MIWRFQEGIKDYLSGSHWICSATKVSVLIKYHLYYEVICNYLLSHCHVFHSALRLILWNFRFGSKCLRIFRLLIMKKQLEQKQVCTWKIICWLWTSSNIVKYTFAKRMTISNSLNGPLRCHWIYKWDSYYAKNVSRVWSMPAEG